MIVSVLMWVVFSITVAYLIVIGIITYGWFNLVNSDDNQAAADDVNISVVIAVRNESSNILTLLKQVVSQDYSNTNFETIIIDDHSTDNTLQLINKFKVDAPHARITIVEAVGNGKKNAIKEGISNSSAELIVTTDGDCIVKPEWLKSIVGFYNSTNCKVILGPVVYENEKSIQDKFFSLDFISLVASGAGSVGVGLPLMGNGANIAFKRDVYYNTVDIGKSKKYTSGDDVFLIHNVAKKYGSSAIGFLLDNKAIVSTMSPKNLSQFFNQRTRWASKTTGYKLIWPIAVALIVLAFNLLLFVMLVGSLWFTWLIPVYFLIIATKFLIDMPLVFSFLSFANKIKLKPLFFVMEFIYPIYIVIAAIASTIFSFDWKGREKLR